MTIYVFTPQGNLVVYEEPWRIVKNKVASGSYVLDTYDPNPGYRYARIEEGHLDSYDLDHFPPEFRTYLLLLGVQ